MMRSSQKVINYYKNLPENVSNFGINISDFSSTTDVYYATSEITDETIESGYTKTANNW